MAPKKKVTRVLANSNSNQSNNANSSPADNAFAAIQEDGNSDAVSSLSSTRSSARSMSMATRLDRSERQNAIQFAEIANQFKALANLISGLRPDTHALVNPPASPNRILNLGSPPAEKTSSSSDIPVDVHDARTGIAANMTPGIALNPAAGIGANMVPATPGGTVLDSFGQPVHADKLRQGQFIQTVKDSITLVKEASVYTVRRLERECRDQERANGYNQRIYLYQYLSPSIRMSLVSGWLAKRHPNIVYTEAMMQQEENKDILFALAQLGAPKSMDDYKNSYRAALRYRPLDKWCGTAVNLHDPKELQNCMDTYMAYMSHIMEIDKYVDKFWSSSSKFRPSVWKPVGQLDGTKENAYLIWILIDVDSLGLCKLMHNKLGLAHRTLVDLELYTAAMTEGFQIMQDAAVTFGPAYDMVCKVQECIQVKPKTKEEAISSTRKAFSILQRPHKPEVAYMGEDNLLQDADFDRNENPDVLETTGINYGLGQTTTSSNMLMAPIETPKSTRQMYPCGSLLRGIPCSNTRCSANHDPNVVRSAQKQIVDAFGKNKVNIPNNIRPTPPYVNAKTHQPQIMNVENAEDDTWSDSGVQDQM